jgi:hypothetical protein
VTEALPGDRGFQRQAAVARRPHLTVLRWVHQTTPGLASGDVEQVRMAPSRVDPCVGGNNGRLNPVPDVVSCGRRKNGDRRAAWIGGIGDEPDP